MGKIYFRTMAFNAEKTIRRCIDSVLNQTYRSEDIVYYVMDNGSTDKTGEIIREYAEKDNRIKAFYRHKNNIREPDADQDFVDMELNISDGDYFCALDADDEYRTDFLENIIPFMECNALDIGVCGSEFIDASSNKVTSIRGYDSPLCLTDKKSFSDYFKYYYQFFRTVWGKLYNSKAARNLGYYDNCSPERYELKKNLSYGADTFIAFSALRASDRIGIYQGTYHKYYVSKKSASYQYYQGRSESDIVLYNDALDFLKNKTGEVTQQNILFLYFVYSNAVTDTANNIELSNLTEKEKLNEYIEVLSRDVTKNVYSCSEKICIDSKANIWLQTLKCVSKLHDNEPKFEELCAEYFPNCAAALNADYAGLFLLDQNAFEALMNDDAEKLIGLLLEFEAKQKYVKKYNITALIRDLSKDDILLQSVCENVFLRKYGNIYILLRKKRYAEALETMTDLLLTGKNTNEVFLQLYLSLAALLEYPDAFIFGKIKMALFLAKNKRFDECRAVLDELSEMGVQDNDDTILAKRLISESDK